MKYCRFQSDFGPQYGEIADRKGTLWIERLLPPPEEDPWTRLPSADAYTMDPLPLELATLLPPVVPSKIVCIGRNYREHAAELGNEVPKEPLLFLKTPSSLIAHEQSPSGSTLKANWALSSVSAARRSGRMKMCASTFAATRS